MTRMALGAMFPKALPGLTDSSLNWTQLIQRPSGDHTAELTADVDEGGTTAREDPPSAGATETPPLARKRSRAPSGDHFGELSTVALSSESGMVRPPPTGR